MTKSRARRTSAKGGKQTAADCVWIDSLESRVLLSIAPQPANLSWSNGTKSVLFIRAAYSDTPTVAQASVSDLSSSLATVNQFYQRSSFGSVSFVPTYTDLVVLPQTRDFYKNAGLSQLRSDALSAAAAVNPAWDTSKFDLDVISTQAATLDGASRGSVASKGLWLFAYGSDTMAHELGHNMGLWHSNSFVPEDGITPWAPGTKPYEYGDSWDIMGAGDIRSNAEFNAWEKYRLGWLSAGNVSEVTKSGVYRLYALDAGTTPLTSSAYALQLPGKSASDSYWVDFRDNYINNLQDNAVSIRFIPNNNPGSLGPQLLDLAPDGVTGPIGPLLDLGVTYSDPVAGFAITPLRRVEASAATPAAIDVQVTIGDVLNDHPPIITSAAASATNVAENSTVTFNATASDPDGDALRYVWDVEGEPLAGQQVNTSFRFAGRHRVRLTVTDPEGQSVSRTFIITAGTNLNPNEHSISGRVVDSGGKPIPNVLVWADPNDDSRSFFRSVYTDDDGTFDIINQLSGTYMLHAGEYGYTFPTQSISLGTSDVGGLEVIGEPKFEVIGEVKDASGAPITGATVSNGSQTTTSGESGVFFLRTGQGLRNITVSKPGFQTDSRQITMHYDDSYSNDFSLATQLESTGLAGTYFDNMDFTGATVTRTDAQVNFNWGLGAPVGGIAEDTFSVRWTSFITAPAGGTYTFYTSTDDGARLWVNNQLLIDKLVPQGTTEWSGSINLAAGQRVPIRMDYFDRYNGAVAKLSWSGPGIAKQIIPASAFGGGSTADTTPPTMPPGFRFTNTSSSDVQLAWGASSDNVGVAGYELYRDSKLLVTLPASALSYRDSGLTPSTAYFYQLSAVDAAGNRSDINYLTATTAAGGGGTSSAGLTGTYFDNMDFTGTSVTRTDQQVNFNWGVGAPVDGIGADTFSARWMGFITAPTSGTYTFYTRTDDGVRLWVNNQLLVDKLIPQGATEWSGTINLTAGQAVPIRMDYFDRYNGAVATLSWSGPGIAKQIIPATALSTDGQVTPPPPPQQKPYLGTPFGDGQVIEAEDFDIGGEGIAYHDTDAGNQSGTFRGEEGVDVGDITGGRVVGRAHEGEWLEYTIRSPYSTTVPFKLDTKYVTPKSGVMLRFLIDGAEAGTVTLASTGSYGGTYATASTMVNIAPGTHVLRVEFAAGGTDVGNFDSFKLTSQQSTQSGTINGMVWNDANANGLRDTGEAPLANWRVFIDGDGDGLFDAGEISALTDSAGKYQLVVAPGSYRVYEVVQAGWRRTTSGYHPITMQAGQSYIGKSFGNVKIA